jgi:hypothetical protein
MKRKAETKALQKSKKISKSNGHGHGKIIEQKPLDLVEEEDYEEELDSDEELQKAFAEKRLTPGLNIVLEPKREHINNTVSLFKPQFTFLLIYFN